jgi:autotransporter-associated beta strand protein
MNREPHLSTGLNPVSAVFGGVRRAGWVRRGALLAMCLAVAAQSQAATISWDGSESVTWSAGGNWVGGTAPTNDLTTDIAHFDLPTYGGAVFSPYASGQRVYGVTIGSSNGAMTLDTNSSGNRLGIGAGGITMAAGAGTLTFGSSTNTSGALIGASQTWTNNSSNSLLFRSVSTNVTGTQVLTFSGSGSGGISQGGVASNRIISNGTIGQTLAIVVDYAGSGGVTFTNANTYTGTTTVKSGTLTLGASGLISDTLVLGDSVGPTSGTLNLTAKPSFSQTNVSGVGLLNIGVGKAITIGGVLAPGNGGLGTLSVTGGVTWNAANAWIFQLGTAAASLAAAETGSTGDLLSLTEAFGQGTGSTFSFDFANTGSDGWYKLVDYGSTTFVAGTNPSFAATNLPAGKTASFVVDSASSALYVQIVPEPATITLATIAVATAVGAWRSRSGSRRRLNVACHRHPAR